MNLISEISDLAPTTFSCLDTIFRLFGLISVALIILGALSGITQAMWRFGLALFGKKVVVIAEVTEFECIKEDLTDSGLIKSKNVIRVSDKQLAKARNALLLIVAYGYLNEKELEKVISDKDSRCGLIVYCPPERGRVSPEEMQTLSKTAFSALCNFRGRLVNDVLLMMLSTSFKKSDLKTKR